MIESDLKRIREAERSALLRIEKAEKESKEKIENAKKEIRANIEREREEILKKIEVWKEEADEEGKREADKILTEYRERVKEIESIGEDRINEIAIEVLRDIFR